MDIANIALGLLNATRAEFGVSNPMTEEVALEKYVICLSCNVIGENNLRCDAYKDGYVVKDYYNNDRKRHYVAGEVTNGCNCWLKLKLRSNSQCPLGKF